LFFNEIFLIYLSKNNTIAGFLIPFMSPIQKNQFQKPSNINSEENEKILFQPPQKVDLFSSDFF
jgi:hypothetical protein